MVKDAKGKRNNNHQNKFDNEASVLELFVYNRNFRYFANAEKINIVF